VVTDFSIQIQT